MSELSDLAGYSGRARLFPLPNLVFFPQVMQPLHIFEPRYRQMTQDALDTDRLIALVLPTAGWENDYAGRPALHEIGCLGRILAEHRLDDGRFNILLRGQARVRIVEEISADKLYRIARTEVLHETPIGDAGQAHCWRKTLIRKVGSWFPNQGEVVEQLRKLLHGDLPLGALCDIIAFALPLEAEFKQTLLEELNVNDRLQILHDFLDAKSGVLQVSAPHFPPDFSVN
jgi:uncharacterized protein